MPSQKCHLHTTAAGAPSEPGSDWASPESKYLSGRARFLPTAGAAPATGARSPCDLLSHQSLRGPPSHQPHVLLQGLCTVSLLSSSAPPDVHGDPSPASSVSVQMSLLLRSSLTQVFKTSTFHPSPVRSSAVCAHACARVCLCGVAVVTTHCISLLMQLFVVCSPPLGCQLREDRLCPV